MEEEFNSVLKKLKAEKMQALTKYIQNYGRQEKFDNILRLCNTVYKQNTKEKERRTQNH